MVTNIGSGDIMYRVRKLESLESRYQMTSGKITLSLITTMGGILRRLLFKMRKIIPTIEFNSKERIEKGYFILFGYSKEYLNLRGTVISDRDKRFKITFFAIDFIWKLNDQKKIR